MVPQAGQVGRVAQAVQSARSTRAVNLIVFQAVQTMALTFFLEPLPTVFSPFLSAQNPVLPLPAFPPMPPGCRRFFALLLLLVSTLINFRFLSQRLDYSEKLSHLT